MTPTGRMAYGMLPRDLACAPPPVHSHPTASHPSHGRPATPRRRVRRATIVTALVLLVLVVGGWSARGVLAGVQHDFDRRADVTVCEFARENRC